MPVLLGVILGVFLTIAGAFAYDASTGRAANWASVSCWAYARSAISRR